MNYTQPDQWQVQILAKVLCKAKVIFVTDKKNKSFVENMHMMWAQTLDDAIILADGIVGKNATITVIPNGTEVIIIDAINKHQNCN